MDVLTYEPLLALITYYILLHRSPIVIFFGRDPNYIIGCQSSHGQPFVVFLDDGKAEPSDLKPGRAEN